jgi:ornithine cyclodeaminase/alanine dehydrogenase-like protein (mu-crystallin family)
LIAVIEEAALRAVVAPQLAVDVIRDAFRADGEGRTRVPPVINLDVPGGEFHVKTAHIADVPHVAVKIASGFYENSRRGLPSGSGLMALFDASTGLAAALLLDNGFLTDIRTGAAGAVAADCLARQHIDTVGVIGAGVQARHQIRCLRIVRSFGRIVVWGPSKERLDGYCEEMRGEGYAVSAAPDVEHVCREADVLITATPSRTPLVRAGWLRPGMHVTAVGSDSPGKQELEAACLTRADLVVVDRRTQCAAFGELSHADGAGIMTIELGEIHDRGSDRGGIPGHRDRVRGVPEDFGIGLPQRHRGHRDLAHGTGRAALRAVGCGEIHTRKQILPLALLACVDLATPPRRPKAGARPSAYLQVSVSLWCNPVTSCPASS